MSISPSARVDPTAIISTEAELGPAVEIGPYAVIEGPVRLGEGCLIRPYAHLIGPLSMGRNNQVFSGAILGEKPQHLKYADEPTCVEIGDDNIFREHVTVHRATTHSWKTIIGHRNFFMANCHIAHDCRIGNSCIMANGALLGGHCIVDDNAYLSGNCAVHQFVRIGRLALLSGLSATTKDIPPFIMQQDFNNVVGVNVVGMRRAGMTPTQIEAVRRAYHVIFRENQSLPHALARAEQELGTVDVVQEMLAFIRASTRGVNVVRDRAHQSLAA
jgi:UDP-N-acetylglucosamine acyltransferase